MEARIICADVIVGLKSLASESVHCVVCSPPYWGLRDYGTGTWAGGDSECPHAFRPMVSSATGLRNDVREHKGLYEGEKKSTTKMPEAQVCRCGAQRIDQQIGLEATPQEFIAKMVDVFREVRRVLRPDGTCWVNMGDSYATGTTSDRNATATGKHGYWQNPAVNKRIDGREYGFKPKDLVGMPWRLAFALQDDGWWLRQDIIWSKPNPMPESVTDRCTKAHEYIFLLTKSARYYYDAEAIKETVNGGAHARGPGNKTHKGTTAYEGGASEHRTKAGLVAYAERQRATGVGPKAADAGSGTKYNESFSAAIVDLVSKRNKRSVWEIATEAFAEAHFATFPTKLVEPCILAGTSEKGVCDNCWTPWVRETERTVAFASGSGRSGIVPEGKHAGGAQEDSGDYDIRMGPITSTKTIGWKRGCSCETDTAIPSTVLDPFNGSGTTGLVALENRCNYIGIELNPEYAAMSERRLKAASAQEVMDFGTPTERLEEAQK